MIAIKNTTFSHSLSSIFSRTKQNKTPPTFFITSIEKHARAARLLPLGTRRHNRDAAALSGGGRRFLVLHELRHGKEARTSKPPLPSESHRNRKKLRRRRRRKIRERNPRRARSNGNGGRECGWRSGEDKHSRAESRQWRREKQESERVIEIKSLWRRASRTLASKRKWYSDLDSGRVIRIMTRFGGLNWVGWASATRGLGLG